MPSKELLNISLPALKRLPVYYNFLKSQEKEGVETITAPAIAKALKLVPIQVRKDIANTGITGKPKTGYGIKELLRAIEDFMGWTNTYDAIIVGTGDLGRALLGYEAFKTYGLNIVKAFDNDPNKVGKLFHNKEIHHVDELETCCKRLDVKTGIITVPAENAQEVAERMIKSGIIAIWNFAPAILDLPEGIIYQQGDIGISLSVLKKKLFDKLNR